MDEGAGTLSREAESLMRWASLLLTAPVMAFSCGPFFSGAWRELRRLRPGMDTPIALGIGAGFAASAWATRDAARGAVYFDSIAMLAFLLLGARYLELAARQRAARSLDRLSRWSPSTALRLEDGTAVSRCRRMNSPRATASSFRRATAIPADGVVEEGCSSVDESLLTGEPVPLAKSPGSALAAGTLNLEQPLVMRVERAGAETRAAAIARLVERAARLAAAAGGGGRPARACADLGRARGRGAGGPAFGQRLGRDRGPGRDLPLRARAGGAGRARRRPPASCSRAASR